MTLVLLSPIGLGAGFWEFGELLSAPGATPHELPGFGSRPRATQLPTMETLADELAERHAGPLDLVGVSMGGMVAQHACIRHPDLIRSAVIACTGASAEPAKMTARAEAAEAGGMEAVLEATLARWFTPTALTRVGHPGVAYAREMLLGLDPMAFAEGWRAIAGHDARVGLRTAAPELTVIAGRDDAAAPVARCAEIVELAPQARLVVLPGPHMLPLERGEEFTSAVRRHLRSLVRG